MGSRQLLSRLEALLVFFRAHVEQRMPLPGFLYTYPLLIVTLLSHFCAAAMPNPSSYKLRRYEPSDKTAVIQLFCDNIREEWGERYHRGVYLANAERYIDSVAENECSDLNNIEGVYFAKGGYFWVLTAQDEDDAVVGCCGLEVISESEVELRRMCISRNHPAEWMRLQHYDTGDNEKGKGHEWCAADYIVNAGAWHRHCHSILQEE